MSKEADEGLQEFGKAAALFPLLLILGAAIHCYDVWAESFVLHKIWEWYAVPRGAPVLDQYAFAVPVFAYVLLKRRMPRNEPPDTRPKWLQTGGVFLYFWAPWVTLAVAWWLK